MKKLFILAVFATLFFSCTKEPQSSEQSGIESSTFEVVDGQDFAYTFTASDRDALGYSFELTNCSLSEYYFKIEVRDVETGARVWRQGGYYAGNSFFIVNLTPGRMYEASLLLSPPHPGQFGTINWKLKNFSGPTICSGGTTSIPSNPQQSLPWPACQP